MKFELGIKTDCIESRYSFDWLFDLLAEEGIPNVQMGSFYELYWVDDTYFADLRRKAETCGLRIRSVFPTHRELCGFYHNDPRMERAARRGFDRLLEVAALVGADYAGSNPGAVLRDHPAEYKDIGFRCWLRHRKELSRQARRLGLKALTIEPMSSLAEPPTTPDEIRQYIGALNDDHAAHPDDTLPTYLCGDTSHGLADADKRVVHSNIELFEMGIPMMCEFHIKNTDPIFNSTFGFSPEEKKKGIVSLEQIRDICHARAADWPVETVVGYLEIPGPKLGRDYTDHLLGDLIRSSLRAIKEVFQ